MSDRVKRSATSVFSELGARCRVFQSHTMSNDQRENERARHKHSKNSSERECYIWCVAILKSFCDKS